MCLGITIRAEGVDKRTLDELASANPLLHTPRFSSDLYIHGCDLLTDEADWNAPAWDMTEEGRHHLAEALSAIFDRLPGEVEIEALWEGDRPTSRETISRLTLISTVAANQVGTKTRYLVAPD